jgi:ATP-dependent RNA helicase SrmB
MLDMGFIKDVNRIVEEARYRKHTMLFSATLEGAGLEKFASEILKDPVELHADALAASAAPSPSGSTCR